MSAGIILINPKFLHNIAGAIRSCSCFGVTQLYWTGSRVDPSKFDRLPREERMKGYAAVSWRNEQRPFDLIGDATPVCIEIHSGAISVAHFNHPENCFYVFGPEDGGVPQVIRKLCHLFVYIPSRHCLNLAAATNVILYDRSIKLHPQGPFVHPGIYEKRGLIEQPGWDGK